MDFEEWIFRPVPTWALLWQQLEEQSDLCNFTVRQGNWSKRYHYCVACASPFVQTIMRNNFDENTTGFLELKLGSPESIDMVMMFLYGKTPMLTIDNVSSMMHLAEMFLIPNLKAFCVNFINKETVVNKGNVEKLLHLSSIFDFDMPTLTKYIRQHLPELLRGHRLLTITADSLENMFSDETLSYVTADVRFEFIMRWVKHSPQHRKPKLDKIFSGIELPEVTADLIEKAKGDKLFEDFKALFETKPETVVKMQSVLITTRDHDYGDFLVFDLDQGKWFRLKSSRDCFERAFTFTYAESILCLVEKSSKKCVIRLYDFLGPDALSCTSVNLSTSHDCKEVEIDNIYISDKVCYAVLTFSVIKPKKKKVQGFNNKTKRFYPMSTIFMGAISECSEETTLTPLLSMIGTSAVKLVVNEDKLIALFSKATNAFCIYDQRSCKMEIIDIKLKRNDEVNPFKDGFVIHDRFKIRFIQSRTGLRNERIFSVYETSKNDTNDDCTLVVVGNKWVRFRTTYTHRYYRGVVNTHFGYTLDELGKVNVNDATWTQIPLPDDIVNDSIIRNIQQIEIPRSKLKCNVCCPHCERIKDEECKDSLYTKNTLRYTHIGRISDWNADEDCYYENDDDYDDYEDYDDDPFNFSSDDEYYHNYN